MAAAPAYEAQSARDLRLTVVAGPVDWEQFTVLESAAVRLGDLRVDAAVIGASHVIRVAAPDFVFHEVFACTRVTTPRPPLFAACLDRIPQRIELACFEERLLYECEIDIRDMNEVRGNEAGDASSTVTLDYAFPPPETGEPSARTVLRLDPDPRDGRLRVRSLHEYPEEEVVVVTAGRITYRP